MLPYTTDWLSRRFTKACAQRMFVGNNRAIVLRRNLRRSLCVLELTLVSARLEGAMDTKLYLTIGAVDCNPLRPGLSAVPGKRFALL